MGVYINMEMPQNHNCVTITIWSNGAASYGLHNQEGTLVDFRNVEVIPVPPHGDLIDRDALKKKRHWTDDFYETEYVEVEEIDAAPTIIPAEEGDT